MDIEVEYNLGGSGIVSVIRDEGTFELSIEEFPENQYADIGIQVLGENGIDFILNDIYNRNSLPQGNSKEELEVFGKIKLNIINDIKSSIESFFTEK